MIKFLFSKLVNRLWPISEFAQELADELCYASNSFVMANSVESLMRQGHIHLKPSPEVTALYSPFVYSLLVCKLQLHLVDGEDLRVTFDQPPVPKPLNWREYELLEYAINYWLNQKWDEVRAGLSDEELQKMVAEA
jgi:hypothetical protein